MLPKEFFKRTFYIFFFLYGQIDIFVDLKVAKFHYFIIFSFRGIVQYEVAICFAFSS